MKNIIPICFGAFMLSLSCSAQSPSQCGDSAIIINTGYNPATATAIVPGSHGGTPVSDPRWKITATSPSIPAAAAGMGAGFIAVSPGGAADVIPMDSYWISNPAGMPGGWVSCVNGIGYYTDGTGPSGTNYNMVVSRDFQMITADNIVFRLHIANDNWISSINVDGVSIGFTQPAGNSVSNYSSFTAFTYTISLSAGTHTIDVFSHNYNTSVADGNPVGINIYGTVSSATGTNSLASEGGTSTSGAITAQPASATASSGGIATFVIGTSLPSPIYQWQENSGAGFVNLVASGTYAGVNTNTLTINSVSPSMDGHTYRCVVTSENISCELFSGIATLHIAPASVNDLNENTLRIYPNPTNKTVHVDFSGLGKRFDHLEIVNTLGQTVLTGKSSFQDQEFDISGLPHGVYIVRLYSIDAAYSTKILVE